ncbi:hypothetical protein ACQ4M3_06810 [Leptolyngbya sp. AN03gr2]|uniref:hypothetical protein n=1 Tax=unclassified Leptolyngbya TaxID=2650499 RepID=UPI003D314536
MTPTLFGRWQTRILLLFTVGLLVTIPFSIGILGEPSSNYIAILVWIALFGIGWDILYDRIQKFRWDRDWPASFQLLAGIWEAIFILFILNGLGIPLPGIEDLPISLGVFIFHYSTVWLTVFTASQTLMRVVFPRWRFRGGKWL